MDDYPIWIIPQLKVTVCTLTAHSLLHFNFNELQYRGKDEKLYHCVNTYGSHCMVNTHVLFLRAHLPLACVTFLILSPIVGLMSCVEASDWLLNLKGCLYNSYIKPDTVGTWIKCKLRL